jgi:hypothetical protein
MEARAVSAPAVVVDLFGGQLIAALALPLPIERRGARRLNRGVRAGGKVNLKPLGIVGVENLYHWLVNG